MGPYERQALERERDELVRTARYGRLNQFEAARLDQLIRQVGEPANKPSSLHEFVRALKSAEG